MDTNLKKNTNLRTNLIFNTLTQFVIYLTPLIVAPYISRILLSSGIGQYSHAYSYVYYFSVAISLGFSATGINKIAANRNDKELYSKYFWAILFEKMLLTVISVSLYFVILSSTKFDGKVDFNVGCALVIVLIDSCLDIKFLFQGLEKFKMISIITMVSNLMYGISVFLFVKNENDVLIYTIMKSSFSFFIDLALYLPAVRLIAKPKTDVRASIQVFKTSLIFFLPTLLLSIGGQLDQTIIGALCSDAEVGYYTQAIKFPTLISNLTYSIAPVMLSRISFLYQENKLEEIKTKISQAVNLALFISIPCCIGLYSIGNLFIPLYFGDDFLSSIPILYILLINTLFSPLSSILINSYFYPTKQTFKLTIFLVCSLIGNIAISIFCITSLNLGGKGAAFGTLTAEFILFMCLLICSCKALNFKLIFKDLWKIVLSSFVMFFLIYFINKVVPFNNLINVFIDVIVGIFSFSFLGLITREYFFIQFLKSLKCRLRSILNHEH